MVHLTTGETALYRAAEQSNLLCAMELLKAGADVNIANKDGQTPLMVAVKNGSISLVALLIHYGADVNSVDNNGMNPLALTLATSAKIVMTEWWHC
ncbi:ankyrin repeat domain-containing protein [Candidatus Dependentiae bacterium]|nr:ankyrin repeat domain-containing protein [Candidatus Dependentiae bacterium]